MAYRNLTLNEIHILEQQHCSAEDWSTIQVTLDFQPHNVHYAKFSGQVKLGLFQKEYILP